MGGQQTIFCLCNSHRSHKHKHKINNGAESGLRSRRCFFLLKTQQHYCWWGRCADFCSALRMTCHGPLQINHQHSHGNASPAKMETFSFECRGTIGLDLILSSCPCRIIIPNTIRQTCQKSPLKAGFVSEAPFYLPEQYTELCTCFRREDTDSFLPLLPSGKYIPRMPCEGEPCTMAVKAHLRDAPVVAKVGQQYASWGLENKSAAMSSK